MLEEEIGITLKVQILFVHKPTIDMKQSEDISDMPSTSNEANENDDFIEAVKDMTDVNLDNVAVMSPVKTVIMKKLLALCTNKIDIILITGNVEFARDCANEAVKAVVTNRNELSVNIVYFIRQIEKELMDIMRHKAECGIRDETLIINLSGPHKPKTKCLKAIADILHSYLEILSDVTSSDDDSLEQNTDGNAINRHTEVFPMISVNEAITILSNLSRESQQNSEIVKINHAYGRILHEKVVSNYDMPPFRTSIKHGYAVLVSDGKSLRKVLNLKNTFSPISLLSGTCVWVNSGAPVPDGATAVVQVKDAQIIKRYNSDDEYIMIMIQPRHGQNIKPIGYDLRKGEIIVDAFTRIGPEEIGLVVASGYKEVKVASQLSVGVLSIGDNLEEPGKPLKPGYIYDINRITLISLLKHNHFHSLDYGIVDNKLLSIRDKIREALKKVNILVTTGSVDEDLLKKVLTKFFEATIHFGNVDVEPGKSTTLATCKINDKTKYFLSLSGNPKSAFIAAQLFLLPFMNGMCYNLSATYARIPVCVDVPYILHRNPSLSLVSLHWSDEKNCLKIYSTDNLFSNKPYNMFGLNALLTLPARTKSKVLSNEILPVVLIDYPRKSFSSPLSSPTTNFK